jgi:hypothetical protein
MHPLLSHWPEVDHHLLQSSVEPWFPGGVISWEGSNPFSRLLQLGGLLIRNLLWPTTIHTDFLLVFGDRSHVRYLIREWKTAREWQWLHNLIQAEEWKVNVTDSYCEYVWSVWNGSLERTFKVFDEMDVWTMLAWKTRIAGLALNWCGRQLLTLWWKMGSRTKQVWLPCSLHVVTFFWLSMGIYLLIEWLVWKRWDLSQSITVSCWSARSSYSTRHRFFWLLGQGFFPYLSDIGYRIPIFVFGPGYLSSIWVSPGSLSSSSSIYQVFISSSYLDFRVYWCDCSASRHETR